MGQSHEPNASADEGPNLRTDARYAAIARKLIWNEFSPTAVEVPSKYRILHPWRALKLIKIRSENYGCQKLEHLNLMDTTILGSMKMFTLFIRPAYAYNLPMFSLDAMIAGDSRTFALELIDPADTTAEAWDSIYRGLLLWQEKTAAMEHLPISEWTRPLLHPASILVKTKSKDDALLLDISRAYLEAFVQMARAAQPLDEAQCSVQRQAKEGYVNELLSRGGPAVNVFKILLGQAGQQEFVRQVMFGVRVG